MGLTEQMPVNGAECRDPFKKSPAMLRMTGRFLLCAFLP